VVGGGGGGGGGRWIEEALNITKGKFPSGWEVL
jgi:hypothetical protein